MEPPQLPAEQRRESRVSDLSASDFSEVPDLQRELAKCVHRIIRDGPRRSTEGSTDLRVDLEHYCENITNIFRKFPYEVVPETLAESIFTPLREEFGRDERSYVHALEGKLREAKKEEEGLKKKNGELTREIKELRKGNDEFEKLEDTHKTLTEENGRLREEAEEAREEAKRYEKRLLKVEGELIEEKERAGENRKKLDGINGMIAEKRREFEQEKMMFEAEREELEMYRRGRDEPALRALLRGTSGVAGEWLEDTKREEELMAEILNSRQPRRHPHPESPKTPDQEHRKGPTAVKSMQRSPFSAVGTPGGPGAVEKIGPAGTSLEDELPEDWQDEGSEVRMARPDGWGDGPRVDYAALIAENGRLKEVVQELRRQIQDLKAQTMEAQGQRNVETPVASPHSEEIWRLEAEIAGLEELESTDNAATEDAERDALRECEECRQTTRRAGVTFISGDGLSEAEDRIRELEDVIISQLDFHGDVQPLLTTTDDLTTRVHAAETELLDGALGLDSVPWKISLGGGEGNEAWGARMEELREREGRRREGGKALIGLWEGLEGARGRLVEVIGDARERLDEDALRLGIKVRIPLFSFNTQKPPSRRD